MDKVAEMEGGNCILRRISAGVKRGIGSRSCC